MFIGKMADTQIIVSRDFTAISRFSMTGGFLMKSTVKDGRFSSPANVALSYGNGSREVARRCFLEPDDTRAAVFAIGEISVSPITDCHAPLSYRLLTRSYYPRRSDRPDGIHLDRHHW